MIKKKIYYKLCIVFLLNKLTKRDELLFLDVLALPYASNTGLAETI